LNWTDLENEELVGSVDAVRFSELHIGVMRFRGFAMLSFGNFRFAFRHLNKIKEAKAFLDQLDPWNIDSAAEADSIKNRSEPLVPLQGSVDLIGLKIHGILDIYQLIWLATIQPSLGVSMAE
jgi:hypothetical protein